MAFCPDSKVPPQKSMFMIWTILFDIINIYTSLHISNLLRIFTLYKHYSYYFQLQYFYRVLFEEKLDIHLCKKLIWHRPIFTATKNERFCSKSNYTSFPLSRKVWLFKWHWTLIHICCIQKNNWMDNCSYSYVNVISLFQERTMYFS